MSNLSIVPSIQLPVVGNSSAIFVDQLTKALGFPREILASDSDIAKSWAQLPDLLNSIPPERRDPLLARMCIAISVGLLDSAINYAWNSAMIELRRKVREFGVPVVADIIAKPFSEKILGELQDSELLQLCLTLNFLTEDGYFKLDQCRDVRNNFSAAHPTIGQINSYEFAAFLSRCIEHALSNSANPKGVDAKTFLSAVRGNRFSEAILLYWTQAISATHEAQRESLMLTLHGIYCDSSVGEEGRLNALAVAKAFTSSFTAKTKSELIERHFGYISKNETGRIIASRAFFKALGMLDLLGDSEKHSIVVNAAKKLMNVHQAFNNFYNEPPFAQRLLEITSQLAVPPTAREEFVSSVVTCLVGNPYGTSDAAVPAYVSMVKSFTPAEVEVIFQLLKKPTTLSTRVKAYPRCRAALKDLLKQIDPTSVPTVVKSEYDKYLK
jgi:hypothetical protein